MTDREATGAHRRATTTGIWKVGTVVVSQSLTALPVFLVGALAVLIRAEIGFSEARLGLAVSAYFGASALGSIPGGHLAQGWGARRALLLAACITSLTLLSIALLVEHWWQLTAALAIAGLASATVQPATNLFLVREISAGRRGLAFGIKQASVPMATLLGGVSVPLIGLTIGWRWAFALTALIGPPLFVLLRRVATHTPTYNVGDDAPAAASSLLWMLALAAGLAGASATALGTFYVESMVARGIGTGEAGIGLVIGSMSAIIGRILVGHLADRSAGDHFQGVAWMLLLGSIGFLLLTTSVSPAILVPATVLGFGAGWGWNGLFHYGVVYRSPKNPAAASGVTGVGVRAGGILGPMTFGVLIEGAGYQVAWTTAAVTLLAAAALILNARRLG